MTILTAVQVKQEYAKYDRNEPDADAEYREGRGLEKRTNALIGITAGLALTTGVLAIFTNWSGDRAEEASSEVARRRGAPSLAADNRGLWLGWTGVP